MSDEETLLPNDSSTSRQPDRGSGTDAPHQRFAGSPTERPGDQIGPYTLIAQIGEGGFGTVWVAERRQPFTQRVALKLIKAGMDTKSVLARFEQERQALAVMNHPNIAKVLDGGMTPAGRPYFAMEFVKGEPVTEFCDARKLGVKARLQLFAQACEAIQHAHLKGIVHRDLKPGNILAFEQDGKEPTLKVIDFGVAKAMSQLLTDKTIFTETGQMIGTPEYMSPEQADPSASDIDTRSDIYSLGVLLYELVTGSPPFDAKTLRARGYGEIQRIIREEDPPSPSARLSTISTKDAELATRIEKARGVVLRDLASQLRNELEWIPLKAMRKEPQHRYQTAQAFAEDVRAYLDGRPIMAAPESTGYRVRKYVRRNTALVTGVAAVALSLVVGLGVATWQWRVAVAQSVRAEAALAVASTASALNAARKPDPLQVADDLRTLESIHRDRSFPAQLAKALVSQSLGEPLRAHRDDVWSVAFSPNGKILASGSDTNDGFAIRLWDGATGAPIGEPLRGHADRVTSICFSPDGSMLASGSLDGTIRLWDPLTGKPVGEPLSNESIGINSLCFSHDGSMLASGGFNHAIRLWDVAARAPVGQPCLGHSDEVVATAFSPDDATLASGSADGTVRLWDVTTRTQRLDSLVGHSGAVTGVAFSPDGTLLASAGKDASVRVWDPATGKPVMPPLVGHEAGLRSIAFAPDGGIFASAGDDGTIRLWTAATGQPVGEPLRGHLDWVYGVCFRPDGRMLASASEDNSIRLWDVPVAKVLGGVMRGHSADVACVAISPDHRTVVSGSYDTTLRLWDAETGLPIGLPLEGHSDDVNGACFTPDGTMVVSASKDKTLRRWNATTGESIGVPMTGHDDEVYAVAVHPDGSTLASGSKDQTVRLWDAATGAAIAGPLGASEGQVFSVGFSPDGSMLASSHSAGISDRPGFVRFWDPRSGASLGPAIEGARGFVALGFHPQGTLLAAGTNARLIEFFDPASRVAVGAPITTQEEWIGAVSFSPDGSTVADCGGFKRDIRLWDAATRKPLGDSLVSTDASVLCLAFSTDGSKLASGSDDATLHLWHATPLKDRIETIRSTLAEAEAARAMLAPQLAAVRAGTTTHRAVQDAMLADPRFVGALRRGALIAIGQAARDDTLAKPAAARSAVDLDSSAGDAPP